ncbi:MAG: HAMP domain-containing protein [Acidobacteria bacterium]|nr:HAMP domain-containing protein [Acidobacteriota bacterium]
MAVSGLLFVVLLGLSFWQTSFDFGDFRPRSPTVTFVLWGISTLVILGVLTLGFLLFRTLLKLYIERRRGLAGSKLKTRLVGGALALSLLPVICMVIFSFKVLNRTLDKWFSYPTKEIIESSEAVSERLNEIMRHKTETDAAWLASLPIAARALGADTAEDDRPERLEETVRRVGAEYVALLPVDSTKPVWEVRSTALIKGPVAWKLPSSEPSDGTVSGIAQEMVWAAAPVFDGKRQIGRVIVGWPIPRDILERQQYMASNLDLWAFYEGERRDIRYFYLGMLALITVFVLFVAVWLSLYVSKQISTPIEALLEATSAISEGRLDYRIGASGLDEIGGLIVSFNQMTRDLEERTRALQQSNSDLGQANAEIESRRRFINAILENITPGVVSVTEQGEILKSNSSAAKIFPDLGAVQSMLELFQGEDLQEMRYLLNRARRIGLASRDFEIERNGRIVHLTVTVSALERQTPDRSGRPSRFVVVLEDTTELLRAQKTAAWNEVARRVAHEIKNPLTPIALSAERMARLMERFDAASSAEDRRDLQQRFLRSTDTIRREVESLRRLVDEFARMAQFPQARPERADLNQVVAEALHVFEGRLADVSLRARLDPDLPAAWIDPEQFKRVVVNLVDNAAEALEGCWVREIVVETAPGSHPESVELVVSDSGPGVSAEDKEKLFLPYFSTKSRGTGLGLAIVSRIVAEHGGSIRVEDNRPSGSRFIVEAPVADPAPVGALA